MRTALFPIVLLTAAAACATSPPHSHTPMDAARGGGAASATTATAATADASINGYGAGDYQPPAVLRARLLPSFGGVVGFQLNRPAHVAIFEVDPRFGIQMIYPRLGAELGMARAGTQTVFGTGGVWGRHGYRSTSHFGLRPIGWSTHGWRMQQVQPRVYYLIASERPLQTERYLRSPNVLEHSLSGLGFSAFNPMHTLDRLGELVLPPAVHRDEYTTDYYVEWPDPVYTAPAPRRTWVLSCPDGTQSIVPIGVTTCPPDRLAPPIADDPPPPPAEEQPQRPERRRPERGGAERGAAAPAQEPGAERPQREPRERGVRPEPGRQAPEAGSGAEPRAEQPRPEPRAAPRPERTRPAERPAPATRPDPPRAAPERSPPAARPQPRPTPSADRPAARPSPAPAPSAAPSRDRSPPPDRTENTRNDPPN